MVYLLGNIFLFLYFRILLLIYNRLTLGILSLDDLNLKVLETSGGSEVEREHARRLLNLLSCGRHWILSVLLLSNSVVNGNVYFNFYCIWVAY